jgi:hypothetical protein
MTLIGCGPAPKSSLSPPPSAPPVVSEDGIFRDVAQQAGLIFRWGHGGKSPLTIIETIGHGCAFLDYDQDGWQDILLVGDARCALYRNRGDGRFEDMTPQSGITASGTLFGVAVGDYDNDGDPDFYLTGYGKCFLYRNVSSQRLRQGSGFRVQGSRDNTQHPTPNTLFEDVTQKAGLGALGPYDVASAAAFADLDNDGRLDLFVGRYIVFTPESQQFCRYQGIEAGCGVKNYNPAKPRVYRNRGNGTFEDMTQAWGFDASHGKCLGVTTRSWEGGSGVSLYAANDEMPGDLFVPKGGRYVNNGVPSATAFNRDGLTQAGMGTDWGDFNNDGREDLVVATFQTEPKSLYRNDGNDLFSEVGASAGIAEGTFVYVAWTAKFFDYDNDGWLDLLFTNGHVQDNVHKIQTDRTYPQPTLLYHNAQGRFTEMKEKGGPAFVKPIVGRGAAIGDYDNDGKMDALLVDEEGAPLLLHNQEKSPHRWLRVRLVGVRSNRDGIGARVRVTADGKTLVRDQQLCGGYISSHDPRLHFGLGTAPRIEKITVRWPSGRLDTIRDVPLDREIELTEGKGLTRGK